MAISLKGLYRSEPNIPFCKCRGYSPFKDTVLELEFKLIKNILFPVFTKQKENH